MPTASSLRLIDNDEQDRFELWNDDVLLAILGYDQDRPRHYKLMHTVVTDDFSHQGIARLLVSMVLTQARLTQCLITPVCSYVQRYLIRFPEYRDLVAAN